MLAKATGYVAWLGQIGIMAVLILFDLDKYRKNSARVEFSHRWKAVVDPVCVERELLQPQDPFHPGSYCCR